MSEKKENFKKIEPLEFEDSKRIKQAGLIIGPLLAIILVSFNPPEGMSHNAYYTSALAIWMATWWITEAFPLAITALLPIVTLPTLGIMEFKKVAESFSNPIIFLFLGGFIISGAMQKYRLHVRLALLLLNIAGSAPGAILAGLMITTGFLAFWMSNTATTIMMLPIAISIGMLLATDDHKKSDGFTKALLIAVAYSSALGGLGTFVGTPVNAILLGHLNSTYGYTIHLTDWMKFGVPIVIGSFISCWCILYFLFVRHSKLAEDAHAKIEHEYEKLGKIDRGQVVVGIIFLLTVTLWLTADYLEKLVGHKIEDAQIALFSALLLFSIPLRLKPFTSCINWNDAKKIPWGILIFFGGSLSLSAALTDTGVTVWLSNELTLLDGMNLMIVVVVLCLLIVAVSELMSNIATITAFLPILTSLSQAIHVNPLLLMVPATLSASCGFMMPGASASNALAYSTGRLKVSDMIKAGFLMNITAVAVIIIATFAIVNHVLKFEDKKSGGEITAPITSPAK